MRIVRVTKEEFELDNGLVYPIIPPLEEETTIEEFQRHYDYAAEVVGGRKEAGSDNPDTSGLGQSRKDQDC